MAVQRFQCDDQFVSVPTLQGDALHLARMQAFRWDL
jgi:hypothetical protein